MLDYLNIGCGDVYHPDWVNVDINVNHPDIITHNILKGLPFEDKRFKVVYFSQLLEHIPRESALSFTKECFRVMKSGAIIRIVVPDLENIVDQYNKLLDENLANSSPLSDANYEWMLLEMFDQTVRNENGGQMSKYLSQPTIINPDFLRSRIGNNFEIIREYYLRNNISNQKLIANKSIIGRVKKLRQFDLRISFRNIFLTQDEKMYLELGAFRNKGEIHYWMYDEYSLKKLLEESGFKSVMKKSPYESYVDEWGKYELDIKNKKVYSPTSLFMEGVKPISNID